MEEDVEMTNNVFEFEPGEIVEKTEIVEHVIAPRSLAIMPPSYLGQEVEEPKETILLDALPYIEPLQDLEIKARAEKLVKDEMATMDIHNLENLSHIPLPETPYIVKWKKKKKKKKSRKNATKKHRITQSSRKKCPVSIRTGRNHWIWRDIKC